MGKHVLCDDVNCFFKMKINTQKKPKDSCCFTLSDAISFFNKYGHTFCELGLGEISFNKAGIKTTNRAEAIRALRKGRW